MPKTAFRKAGFPTQASITPHNGQRRFGLSFFMIAVIALTPMFAAAGYALIYLLLGGGFGGAVLVFLIAKMLGR